MKINEILVETVDDIKLLIKLAGFDVDEVANKSQQIKNQFLTDPHNSKFIEGMKYYLTTLNFKLHEISSMPQWSDWSKTPDGKMVQREMDNLYNANLEFIRKYGN